MRLHRRAEAVLIGKCRAGQAEALRALAELMAPAIWASRSEEAGAMEAWRAVLRRLSGWSEPTLAELYRVAGADPDAEAEAPVEIVDLMVGEALGRAKEIAEAVQRRAFWLVQAYAIAAALVVVAAMMLVGPRTLRSLSAVSPLMVEGVKARIAQSGLPEKLRDLSWQLSDPLGEDQWAAQVLEDAALVLEEISNLPAEGGVPPTLIKRVRGRRMAEKVALLADQWGGTALAEAQQILEEVANWQP